jgi:hypothetical protein
MDQYVLPSGHNVLYPMSVRVAARCTAWVCGRSLAGIAASNRAGGYGCLSVVSFVCCQVEVSATG